MITEDSAEWLKFVDYDGDRISFVKNDKNGTVFLNSSNREGTRLVTLELTNEERQKLKEWL